MKRKGGKGSYNPNVHAIPGELPDGRLVPQPQARRGRLWTLHADCDDQRPGHGPGERHTDSTLHAGLCIFLIHAKDDINLS